ncbi:MAG: UvrD-helicase domain-containing protein [Candidatus Kapabacteria bacterium]|nr:UvrD-helicase domain-containing protein [Candidatus Kapabacteria bacterium]
MKAEKPTLVIAGAGSGKTTNMVKKIVESLPELEPYRFLAAITYTNAAANSIKERLSQHTKIPANVFVGTIDAFFNKFLILPYATLHDITQVDKLFIELNIETIAKEKFGTDFKNKNGYKKNLLNSLLKKGVIPFSQISEIAEKLIVIKEIQELVGKRLQFLFVDEFQDTNIQEFKVFDKIHKAEKTKLYKVGDAEQYIMSFRFNLEGNKAPLLPKIPIIQHQKKFNLLPNLDNNRCSHQITTFINNFNTQLQQEARFSTVEKNGVFFISHTDLLTISNTFKEKTEIWKDEPDFKRFYLAYSFKSEPFKSLPNQLGLIQISNESKKTHHLLSEVIHIITKIVGLNSKQICEKYNINTIQLRTLAIKIWKKDFVDFNEFKTYFEQDLALHISTEEGSDAEKFFDDLQNLKIIPTIQQQTEYTTTIHKSKGLEATCVLVVAKTNNELTHWLETDKEKRLKDKNDTKRLGFVAFSRAKTALYIACLEELSKTNKNKLMELKVATI